MNATKFKINNLEALQIIQSMVYINIATPKEDREHHDLICGYYLQLRYPYTKYKFIRKEGLLREYLIEPAGNVKYKVLIDLSKNFYNCAQVTLIIGNRVFNPCTINVFNIEFVK